MRSDIISNGRLPQHFYRDFLQSVQISGTESMKFVCARSYPLVAPASSAHQFGVSEPTRFACSSVGRKPVLCTSGKVLFERLILYYRRQAAGPGRRAALEIV